MVMYRAKTRAETRLFVAETEFDRNMSRLMKGAIDAKTIIFPSTVRDTYERAFSYSALQSVVLNEGLETLGEDTFCNSKIKRITVPKSVTKIEDRAFENCERLRGVIFADGSKLEKIGRWCFQNSGLEEITLPKTLRYVGCDAFADCKDLRTIYVEDGCEVDFEWAEIPGST